MLRHGIVPWLVFAIVLLSTILLSFRSDSFLFLSEQDSFDDFHDRANDTTSQEQIDSTQAQIDLPWANLHLLMPATAPDQNLCKAMLSAQISGYPSPVILNWGLAYNDSWTVGGGTHLAKIHGAHRFLAALDPSHDDDLVVMIDAYDVWLQLRPQVLIDRYFRINERADYRIRQELGDEVMRRHGIRQRIVIGAEKRCWPWRWDDPPCYAAPAPTLPKDVFGPLTDTEWTDRDGYVWSKNRPRYLNSGLMIGDVAAMRRMFERAKVLVEKEPNLGSDQWIFAHIFGDQEIYRATVGDENASVERIRGLSGNIVSEDRVRWHLTEVRSKALNAPGGLDFGIGLDLKSELTKQTGHSENDSAWFVLRDQSQVQLARQAANLTYEEPMLPGDDIVRGLSPYWALESDNSDRQWEEVPILTNVFTGTSPVAIHHNGDKSRRETWWTMPWWAAHIRDLFDATMKVPPLAYGFNRKEWWPYEKEKAGGRDGLASPDAPWLRFEDMCSEYHDELFRDGKGPWVRRDMKV